MKRTVQINEQKVHSIQRRHPWIFSGAITSDTSRLSDGDIVEVVDHKKEYLAKGIFHHATIAVRILTFEKENIDNVFFRNRINAAFELRNTLNLLREDNSIFRLIHGEGDGLPGLIIDYYNGVAVVQCHSIGMYNLLDKIKDALTYCLGDNLQAIYSKSSDSLPGRFDPRDEYLMGSCETPHTAIENGINYKIDWVTGQKTGFFIDQRENRSLLGEFTKGKTVLNTFCYSGGFSLAALQAGANVVHSLDSSAKAIDLTEQNLEVNKFDGEHKSIIADAMQYIKELPQDYDVIVLDPPAFAKSKNKRHRAVQGYKRLNRLAIEQIKPGGIIFTFSCSQVVDKELFTSTVRAAAIEANRNVRILMQLHQPADHPISIHHPEGEYLKGLVIQVD